MNDREKMDMLTTNLNDKFYLQPKYIKNAQKLFNFKVPLPKNDYSNIWERRLFIMVDGEIYKYYKEEQKTIQVITSTLHPGYVYDVVYFHKTDSRSGYTILDPVDVMKRELPYMITREKEYYDGSIGSLRKIGKLIFNKYADREVKISNTHDDINDILNVQVECNFTVSVKDMLLSTAVYVHDRETFTGNIIYKLDSYNDNLDIDDHGNILLTNERYISEYTIVNELLFKNNKLDHKCMITSIADNKSYTSHMGGILYGSNKED